MIGIYKITSPSGKVYIGQAVCIIKRKRSYEKLKCKGQPKLYNSLIKYGFSEHIFQVIEECSVEKLNIRERYWQDFYDVLSERGLNCKLTNTVLQKQVHSPETIHKIRLANKGKAYRKGTKHSEESKSQMSAAKLGVAQSEETKRKRVKTRKGYGHSESVKEQIRQSALLSITEEERERRAERSTMIRNIEQRTLEGVLVRTYPTIREAVKDGYSRCCIKDCLTGRQKSHRGFIWKIL